ncbi:MAG: tRNA (N6-isopentenyl adenosine(37)-C2)-methylthiotransferase MiaB [Verrucomicrobia bacterium]|nr:tRNA (N6-isopentenyl adenosine(37)-C2)-methylthiotransferase MiaB [Verrucomicrobiota bacterium]MBS0637021.1 tRNA (N6-isopentenyl adenosine(37)-C2)-methylthiotransferase MiaB [Verrucomicrobiota bacterium]
MKEAKTFFMRTYGCQMNENDTEVMVGMLEKRGLKRTDDESGADLLLFNTCSIRDLAERKVMGKLGKLGKLRQNRPIIGITGCMANAKKETLFKKVPHIDFVLGTNNIHELNSVLDEVLLTGKQQARVDMRFEHELDYLQASRPDKVKAYVSIIRGCSKYCTYCVVPYTRGPEVSRTPESILEECQALADQGYKEITLLGQNVNSYGKDKPEWNTLFHDLLYKVDSIKGIERVRFMTSHPVDITLNLMQAIRDLKSLCEFVHFPIQAGSDRILHKMHRLYTKQQYLEKVQMLRELVPGVQLGTDIIVGFPTETDAEFQETYDVLEQLEYSVAFLFAYSPRKGTPAMRWMDDIPEAVKDERLQRLIALQNEIYKKQRQDMLGQVVEVLVEGVVDSETNSLKGRTRCWKNVVFQGPETLVGTLQNVRIHSFNHQTMAGDLVPKSTLQILS